MDKKKFDEIIRDNLVKKEGCNKSFVDGQTYYNLPAFNRFVSEMKKKYPMLYKSYYNGKGSELKSQNGRMPKMASVASSSRFCYLALRDIKGKTVEVEKPCRIKGIRGTCPQMDAYIKEDNAFIEVKCHEIFDKHKTELSVQYWKYLFGEGNSFGFKKKEEPAGNTFELKRSDFDINTKTDRFDFKQFLCHLLGIAFSSDENSTEEGAKLAYLFFQPMCENTDMNDVFKELKEEIRDIFESKHITNFCSTHNIKLYAIVQNAPTMERLTKEPEANYSYLYGN